jgi:DNA integrity scanning protein DisA with diadenylate cyclase activity
MSHNSDATVFVVSEEDGMISYAASGELIRGVSVEYVRGRCYEYYGVKLD